MSIESTRLGVAKAILVYRYLDIFPDVSGTYEILYEHFDYADGKEIGHHYLLAPKKVSLTKGTPARILLPDYTSMYDRSWDATRYEPAILLINGFVNEWKRVELRMNVKIKDPTGATYELNNFC